MNGNLRSHSSPRSEITPGEGVPGRLAALGATLGARASGLWRVEGDRLDQVAFAPAPDLPEEVARGFAAATRSVGLLDISLGIVRAATSGEICVSIAAGLPAGAGSGRWLRAFGAARSVAVPILGEGGRVAFVASVALGIDPDAGSVAGLIRAVDWRA